MLTKSDRDSQPEVEIPLPPSRGLVPLFNKHGSPLALTDVKRWVQLNRLIYKTDKVDVLVSDALWTPIRELLAEADAHDVALSLRTNCDGPPVPLAELKSQGLHDVLLSQHGTFSKDAEDWLVTCHEAALPVRLLLTAHKKTEGNLATVASRWSALGVKVVQFLVDDPFSASPDYSEEDAVGHSLSDVSALADALEQTGIDVSIHDVPYCLVDASQWPRIVNEYSRLHDHQSYSRESLKLATQLYARSPFATTRVLRILLARATHEGHPAEDVLFPWLLRNEFAHVIVGVLTRLLRPLRFFTRTPEPIESSSTKFEAERSAHEIALKNELPEECTHCSLNRVCDHGTVMHDTADASFERRTQTGKPVVDALLYSATRPKYYDDVDQQRRERLAPDSPLAHDAALHMAQLKPDRYLSPKDYGVRDTYFERYEGGLKWFSVSNVERESTPLAKLSPPFTVAFDVGGGIADYAGFALGRHCKLMSPMTEYRQSMALHVNKEGAYVLMRNGVAVPPMEFQGHLFLPPRLGDVIEPAISLWHIEDTVTTSNVRIWSYAASEETDLSRIRYSIIIVSTKFTRRLQAVLRCLAHQQDFDLSELEVIVCYVPGTDATDDLLDSVSMTYPSLRIVRSPFPERNLRSKGFLINESARAACGEWIVLLDSDTLLPPTFFSQLSDAPDEAQFVAPDGRKMLPPDTTARILMGEIEPWEEWGALVNGAGEYRHREAKGVPVGFCQCFRSKHLKSTPYIERDNFEWADMDFGLNMIERFGEAHRLSGCPVLHLDHGSSRWFGTDRHL